MRRLLIAPVLALMATFFVAAPASAATVDSFTIVESGTTTSLDGETVPVGTAVDITYSATVLDSGTVVRSGGGTGVPGFDDDDADDQFQLGGVTLNEPGTYTLLLEVEDADGPGSDSVTITVTDATTEIEPEPITFPDQCTAILPEQDNVSYGVGFGQSGNSLDPGPVDLGELYNDGNPIVLVINPAPGFSFPDDFENVIELTVSEDCLEDTAPVYVEAEAICQGVTFTNVTDQTFLVQYGNEDEPSPDDEFELAGGASRTVSTARDLVFFIAVNDELFQEGEVEVEQDCTPASAGAAHPTVAPAAGSGDGSTAGATGILAALALLAAAGLGAARLRQTA